MRVLSLHYLPCIYWFQQLLNHVTILDLEEHYIKQTYRSRCVILSANGPLTLTIPVKKKQHLKVSEIEIENEFNWQKQHWEAICSAYNHYFEPLYFKKYKLLKDFNIDLIEVCLKLLKQPTTLVFSENYVEHAEHDFRIFIHPKHKIVEPFKPYLQVFSEKFPFQENLSVIDLLFNLGPQSLDKITFQ